MPWKACWTVQVLQMAHVWVEHLAGGVKIVVSGPRMSTLAVSVWDCDTGALKVVVPEGVSVGGDDVAGGEVVVMATVSCWMIDVRGLRH